MKHAVKYIFKYISRYMTRHLPRRSYMGITGRGPAQAADESGYALMVVLAALLIISLSLFTVVRKIGLEYKAVMNVRSAMRAEEIARQGVEEALKLLVADNNGFDSQLDEWANPFTLEGDFECNVRITDVGSRINIRTASPNILLGLEGFNPDAVDAFVDWRDADDLTRPNGAEEEYYRSLPSPYSPRNGLFGSIEELRLVKGFSNRSTYGAEGAPAAPSYGTEADPATSADFDNYYEKVKDFITVYPRLDPNTASIESFDSLLLEAGIDTYRSVNITNELISYRNNNGAAIKDLNELTAILPSMSRDDFQKISGFMSVNEKININLAPQAVVEAVCRGLDMPREKTAEILQRRTAPISDIQEVLDIFEDDEMRSWFSRYFGTESKYFLIESNVRSGDYNLSIEVAAERMTDDEGPKIRIISWQTEAERSNLR